MKSCSRKWTSQSVLGSQRKRLVLRSLKVLHYLSPSLVLCLLLSRPFELLLSISLRNSWSIDLRKSWSIDLFMFFIQAFKWCLKVLKPEHLEIAFRSRKWTSQSVLGLQREMLVLHLPFTSPSSVPAFIKTFWLASFY